jgi:hypothetical protein
MVSLMLKIMMLNTMQTLTKNPMPRRTSSEPLSSRFGVGQRKCLLILLLAGVMTLSACGGGSNNSQTVAPSLSGNWQFTMAAPGDGSFSGGLQGGFISQASGSSVTGAVAYSVALPGSPPSVCNSGSAAVTGTISGQNVNLAAVAGTQTFTLTGTLSLDGSTIVGTYSSTAGTAADGSVCGTVQTGLIWNAILVPPIIGPIQGSFYSVGGTAGLSEQEFLVTSGFLSQAANNGTDNAAVTGSLSFEIGTQSDYPCILSANVQGQISGTSVALQILDSSGTQIGQIGISSGSSLQAVTYDTSQGGYALQSLGGPGYAVYAPGCGGGSLASPADFGNVCLAVNNTKACQQPFTLVPSAVSFPAQVVGSPSTTQTITLTNASSTILSGLIVTLANTSGAGNFAETDNCGLNGAASLGQSFNLNPQQACEITIAFTPQQSSNLTATLTIGSPDTEPVLVPITGTGASSTQSSASEFDHHDVEHHAEIY